MATIYAPGSSQSTYFKKLSAQVAAPVVAAARPAATSVNQQMTAMGIPQGTMTMGPTGSISQPGDFGGNFVQGGQAPAAPATPGMANPYQGIYANAQPAGPTIYAPNQQYTGPGPGATIYEPNGQTQAPAKPNLNANKPGFMTQQLQGYRTVIPNAAGGAAAGKTNGGTGGDGSFSTASPAQVQAIVDLLSGQQSQANAANQARYDQLLAGADQLGRGQMQQNQAMTTQALANSQQSLTNRGLGNSTIVDTVNRGILSDQSARNLATQEAVTSNKQGIIERRTDEGPELGLYAQLLSQPGGAAIAAALLKATQKKAK